MRRDVETYTELCDALTEPKASLASACRAIGLSVASAGRWLRTSKLTPADNEFLWRDEMAPLHIHARRASKIGFARYLAGEQPSRPIRHRRLVEIAADQIEDDPTADAVAAPVEARHDERVIADPSVTVTESAPAGAPYESELTRDLRQRLEARKTGTPLPPLVPVRGAAPSPRYISPEDKSEGIGHGEPKPGGFKVQ